VQCTFGHLETDLSLHYVEQEVAVRSSSSGSDARNVNTAAMTLCVLVMNAETLYSVGWWYR
jgi:hypothetical protein